MIFFLPGSLINLPICTTQTLTNPATTTNALSNHLSQANSSHSSSLYPNLFDTVSWNSEPGGGLFASSPATSHSSPVLSDIGSVSV